MRRIVLFAEDYGHEAFITALVQRLAHEYGIDVEVIKRSATGGHGKVISEFRSFLRDLSYNVYDIPDLLIIVTDANCKGYVERKREIDEVNKDFKYFTLAAIPDPHIERWLLLDSAAFKEIFGKGCNAPDKKCERDRYKRSLLDAIRAVGIVPPLGGIEYAEDIVNAMDMERMEGLNASFGRFFKELRSRFKQWSQG